MKFGVCLPNYGIELTAEGLTKFTMLAEELGFDSAWTTDHILMPKASNTPYESIYESIGTLFYVAAKTGRIKLGVSSLVMGMRNPVLVAKELSTLDNLSMGRVILATGAGWNRPEFENLGADFHNRGRRLNDSIVLIRKLWESKGEAVSYKSRFFNVSNAVFLPEPFQERLTIWIAGSSDAAMKRAARLGDAWHPNVLPLDTFSALVKKFRQLHKDLPICVRIAVLPGLRENEYTGPQGEKRFALTGKRDSDLAALEQLRSIGVSYAILALNPTGNVPISEQVRVMREMAEVVKSLKD
ncbi:MAG: TIGR03619 family F420-dependent LLM class oxidoreductase [Conexivisphaerales archaeon]